MRLGLVGGDGDVLPPSVLLRLSFSVVFSIILRAIELEDELLLLLSDTSESWRVGFLSELVGANIAGEADEDGWNI